MRLQSYKKARTAQYILPKKHPPFHIKYAYFNLYHPYRAMTTGITSGMDSSLECDAAVWNPPKHADPNC